MQKRSPVSGWIAVVNVSPEPTVTIPAAERLPAGLKENGQLRIDGDRSLRTSGLVVFTCISRPSAA